MKKLTISLVVLLLALCLTAGLLPTSAQAASGGVWDGTVDISWYDPALSEYHLYIPAQLAGLAALVNGSVDSHVTDDMIIGDRSLIRHEADPTHMFPGQSVQKGTALVGLPEFSFADKVIYLEADMDMGGETEKTNWMPIGGLFPVDPAADDYYDHVVYAWFAGTIEGQGHRIENLYCYRETPLFHYSQGVGLVGQLGVYSGQDAPETAPAIRNLSVSGYVNGGRMAGGIVGIAGSGAGDIHIENCANHAFVEGNQSKGKGGVVGVAFGGGAIINCYNDGGVYSPYSTAPCGGIIGDNTSMDIYCCYSVGTVTANYGRALGSGDDNTASYTVSDCYYLLGSDSDSASNGWYTGSNTLASVSVRGMTDDLMRSADLAAYLNVDGPAYVYDPDGYPKLFWEVEGFSFSSHSVTVDDPEGGTVGVNCGAAAPTGCVVYMTHEEEPGYGFRKYIVNGAFVTGYHFTVGGDTVVSASLSSLQAGILDIPYNPACEIMVTKTGTAELGGEVVSVTDYPVASGDYIYEGDMLTASAVYREGAYPEDPNLVYLGMVEPDAASAWQFAFTYTGGEETPLSSSTHTVTEAINADGAALTLTVVPGTTAKRWSSLADTSWYSDERDSFTLTTARQLAGLITLVNEGTEFKGKTVRLGCDISLTNDDGSTGARCWDGIGTIAHPFRGVLDGQGYKITDMRAISAGSYAALFKYTSGAAIENLTVSGSAEAKGGAAGIVSQCADTAVTDCRSFVTVTESAASGTNGGIAARVSGASRIEGCFNYEPVSGADGVGGIVGVLADAASSVSRCVNYGEITGNGDQAGANGIGGVIGQVKSGSTISQCANYGGVSGGSQYVGGVFGTITGSSVAPAAADHCYNAGAVRNLRAAGYQAAGGVAGYLGYAALSGCFDYGAVTGGAEYTGGLIGRDMKRASASITGCYYLNTACAHAENSGDERTASAGYAVSALDAAAFRGAELLRTLSGGSGDYVLNNGAYPELSFAAAGVHTHTGGTATCAAAAVCDGCGLPYGETNPENHIGQTELVGAFPAVWTTDGYTGDVCCAGCGAVLERGEVIPADAEKIVFTVYEQYGDGERRVAKEYTALELTALEDGGPVRFYQYGSGTEAQQTFVAAARYVELFALLDDAGVSFAEGDTLTPENASPFPYDYIVSRDRFWWKDESGALQSEVTPAVIAFTHGSGVGSTEAAEADAHTTGDIRLCYGILESEYLNVGGFRLVSNIGYIVITHPERTDRVPGDVNEDGVFTAADIGAAIQYTLGQYTPTAAGIDNGDVDRNGRLDGDDIDIMTRYYRHEIGALE